MAKRSQQKRARSKTTTRQKTTQPKGFLAELSVISPELQWVLDDVAYLSVIWKQKTFDGLALSLAGAVWIEKRRRGVL